MNLGVFFFISNSRICMGGLSFVFWDWKYPVFGACVEGCMETGI